MDNLPLIIHKAQRGDKQAFGVLYTYYYPKIYRYCSVNIYRDDLAQDLTQETFIKAWKALPNFKQTATGTFQAFLFSIARNLLIDLSRKKKEFTLQEYEEMEVEEDYAAQVDAKDAVAKLKAAVSKLHDLDRQIIILRYFEDMSHKDCAKILGIKEGALRVRTIRILKKMQEMVKK